MFQRVNESIQDFIKRRDNFRCRLCGKYDPEGYIHVLSIHHVPVHEPHNLVYLCSECHEDFFFKDFPSGWKKYARIINHDFDYIIQEGGK